MKSAVALLVYLFSTKNAENVREFCMKLNYGTSFQDNTKIFGCQNTSFLCSFHQHHNKCTIRMSSTLVDYVNILQNCLHFEKIEAMQIVLDNMNTKENLLHAVFRRKHNNKYLVYYSMMAVWHGADPNETNIYGHIPLDYFLKRILTAYDRDPYNKTFIEILQYQIHAGLRFSINNKIDSRNLLYDQYTAQILRSLFLLQDKEKFDFLNVCHHVGFSFKETDLLYAQEKFWKGDRYVNFIHDLQEQPLSLQISAANILSRHLKPNTVFALHSCTKLKKLSDHWSKGNLKSGLYYKFLNYWTIKYYKIFGSRIFNHPSRHLCNTARNEDAEKLEYLKTKKADFKSESWRNQIEMIAMLPVVLQKFILMWTINDNDKLNLSLLNPVPPAFRRIEDLVRRRFDPNYHVCGCSRI